MTSIHISPNIEDEKFVSNLPQDYNIIEEGVTTAPRSTRGKDKRNTR